PASFYQSPGPRIQQYRYDLCRREKPDRDGRLRGLVADLPSRKVSHIGKRFGLSADRYQRVARRLQLQPDRASRNQNRSCPHDGPGHRTQRFCRLSDRPYDIATVADDHDSDELLLQRSVTNEPADVTTFHPVDRAHGVAPATPWVRFDAYSASSRVYL